MKKIAFLMFGFIIFSGEAMLQPAEILSHVDLERKTPTVEVMEKDCVCSKGVLQDEFRCAMDGDERAFHSLLISLANNYISYNSGVLFNDDVTRYYVMIRTILSVMSTGKFEKKPEVWGYAFAYLLQALYNIEDSVVSSSQKSTIIPQIEGYLEHQ